MSEDQVDQSAAAAAGGQNEDDRKVFAGGLPQEASEADIKEYFAGFGGVASVNLKMDPVTGRSRGFAFIVFDGEETLANVLDKEHAIKGKKVAVKKAASKQGKVYVGKFTEPITEDQIKEHFSQYGNVVEIQRPVDRSKNSEPKNFCFITFDKEEPAEALLKKANVTVNGQEVQIKKVAVKDAQGGMRGGFRGGRGGGGRGGQGGGQGGWGGGYDQGWGGYGGWGDYGAGGAAWGGYGGYGGGGYGGGGGGWGAWGGGGGKMGAGMQGQQGGGGGYRGSRGSGRGGRAAPY